jgi:hypothetical protein
MVFLIVRFFDMAKFTTLAPLSLLLLLHFVLDACVKYYVHLGRNVLTALISGPLSIDEIANARLSHIVAPK